jgi:outer membrane immunogenic protein
MPNHTFRGRFPLVWTAFRGIALGGAATVAFTTCSVAADLGPYAPPPAAPGYGPAAYTPFTWSGFYLGVQAGYGWGTTDATSRPLTGGPTTAFSYDTSGFLGGMHAGFNWQTGNFVLGVETDIEGAGIDGSGLGTFGGGHITNIDWLGSFRGRVGIASGSALFYLTGGLAYGGVTIEQTAGAGFAPFVSNSDWRTGWTLGGGIEYAFNRNMSMRLEYRYTDLGNATFSNTANNVFDSSDVTQSAVRAGLSFRF